VTVLRIAIDWRRSPRRLHGADTDMEFAEINPAMLDGFPAREYELVVLPGKTEQTS
jgi:hypothetical protein